MNFRSLSVVCPWCNAAKGELCTDGLHLSRIAAWTQTLGTTPRDEADYLDGNPYPFEPSETA